MNENLKELSKKELIDDINERVINGILEKSNADLLIKLIKNSETQIEANNIAMLGTTYKRTGFHFDKRLEKEDNTIKYFKKNEKLSFITDSNSKTHKLIIGENYHSLLNLLIQYKNKIDIIYIDPPYGKDSMGEFAKTNYNNAITRDNLLSMLYLRLRVAKQLLSDDGVIFCSIDDKNQAYIKLIFDEIFGEKNFVKNIIRKTKSYDRTKGDSNFQDLYDFVLCYCKNKDNIKFKQIISGVKEYEYKDEKGEYRLTSLQQPGGQHATRDERPNLYYPIYYNNETSEFSTIKKENYIEILPKKIGTKDGCWMWSKEKFDKDNKDCIVKNDKIFIKRYFDENEDQNKYKHLEPLLLDFHNSKGTTNLTELGLRDVFDFAKPVELIKYLINTIDDSNVIVLDFFAGSGTTGQAVLELNKEDNGNRKFILCQSNEKTEKNSNGIAYDVTSERLRRVMTGKDSNGTNNFEWIKENEKLGDNLDIYEINSVSNFENNEGKSPFEVIDETLYGKEKKFKTIKEKIEWVCNNFDITQKEISE